MIIPITAGGRKKQQTGLVAHLDEQSLDENVASSEIGISNKPTFRPSTTCLARAERN
jgi:hypothetical protein